MKADVINNIDFYSDKAKSNITKKNPKKRVVMQSATSEEKVTLLKMLRESKDEAICLCTFSGFADNLYWKLKASSEHGYPPPLKTLITENASNAFFGKIFYNQLKLIKY